MSEKFQANVQHILENKLMDPEDVADILVEQLKEGEHEVTFMKISTGKKRVMRCTLNSDIIAERSPETGEKAFHNKNKVDTATPTHTPSDHYVLPVYDLEKDAWRSFAIENVIKAVEL